MKIVDVQTISGFVNWRNWLFVRVTTDEGINGVSEATTGGFTRSVEACIHELKPTLIGRDPFGIQRHWDNLYAGKNRFRGGPVHMSAIAGLDMALWDIAGKCLGAPVYRLLGGPCRDKVRVYASGWAMKADPKGVAEQAIALTEQGFRALKIGALGAWDGPTERDLVLGTARYLEAIRVAVGEDVDLMVDGGENFNLRTAVDAARAWRPYRLFWFEEPLRHENSVALADLAQEIDIPVAAGESLYDRFAFRPLLQQQAVDIIQPDVTHAGGLSETKRLADMAEAYSVSIAPHNSGGPLAIAASLHLAACAPNFLVLELFVREAEARARVTGEASVAADGFLPLPMKPGLGLDIDEAAFADYPAQPMSWEPPTHFNVDRLL